MQVLEQGGRFHIHAKIVAREIGIAGSNKDGLVPGERFFQAAKEALKEKGEGKGKWEGPGGCVEFGGCIHWFVFRIPGFGFHPAFSERGTFLM